MQTPQDSEKNRVFSSLSKEDLSSLLSTFVEVELLKDANGKDTFSLVRETLSRIGVRRRDNLFPTAHILHKKGRYYIVHFKQLFMLDGDASNAFCLGEEDTLRLKKIVSLLVKWGMVRVLNEEKMQNAEDYSNVYVHVVSHEDVKLGKIQIMKKYSL